MTTSNDELLVRLTKIETLLASLVEQRTIKEWYSTAEVATLLGKAEFTVREWCRLGRVHAEKKKSGRGVASEWIVSHAELTRVRNEGLLPDPRPYRHVTLDRSQSVRVHQVVPSSSTSPTVASTSISDSKFVTSVRIASKMGISFPRISKLTVIAYFASASGS